jgi:hypothetical protein
MLKTLDLPSLSLLSTSSATCSSEAEVEPIMVSSNDILSLSLTFYEAENDMNATV